MKYPKQVMTIKELRAMGFPDEWLRSIYRNRHQNIAWKMGGEDKPEKKKKKPKQAKQKKSPKKETKKEPVKQPDLQAAEKRFWAEKPQKY